MGMFARRLLLERQEQLNAKEAPEVQEPQEAPEESGAGACPMPEPEALPEPKKAAQTTTKAKTVTVKP